MAAKNKATEGPVLYSSWTIQLDRKAKAKMVADAKAAATAAENASQDARDKVSRDRNGKRSQEEAKTNVMTVQKMLGSLNSGADKVLSAIATQTRNAFVTMGTVGAGVLTASLAKGMGRLNMLEGATVSLVGQGFSDKFATEAMAAVNKVVTGTSFGLDTGAMLAASFASAGIEDITSMETALRRTADAASLMGGDLEGVGHIMSKVLARGRVQAIEIEQFVDRGFGAWKLLAEDAGVSVAEMQKQVTAGEVSAEQFMRIFDRFDGAALRSGDTMKGAAANLGAAFGRTGQGLLLGSQMDISGGVLSNGLWKEAVGLLKDATGWMNRLVDRSKAVGDQLQVSMAGPIEVVSNFFRTNDPTAWATMAGRALQGVGNLLADVLPLLLDLPARFSGLFENVSMTLSGIDFVGIGNSMILWLQLSGTAVANVLPFMVDLVNLLAQFPGLLPTIVGGLLLFRAVTLSLTAISAGTAAVQALAGALNLVGKSRVVIILTTIIGLVSAAIIAIDLLKNTWRDFYDDVSLNFASAFGMDVSAGRERLAVEKKDKSRPNGIIDSMLANNEARYAPAEAPGGNMTVYYPQVAPTSEQQRRSGSIYSGQYGL